MHGGSNSMMNYDCVIDGMVNILRDCKIQCFVCMSVHIFLGHPLHCAYLMYNEITIGFAQGVCDLCLVLKHAKDNGQWS